MERRTNRQTDGHTMRAYTALAYTSCGENEIVY